MTFPVLLDADHLVSELYAISNIPTVIWIDEKDRIVRPNAAEFGTDIFAEITGVRCGPHMDMVRSWVSQDSLPEDQGFAVADFDNDQLAARLHFRIAVHARRKGLSEAAERNFDLATSLAPLDFTVVRAAMPLRGKDPFGSEFFELYSAYQEAGSPYHGIPRTRQVPAE